MPSLSCAPWRGLNDGCRREQLIGNGLLVESEIGHFDWGFPEARGLGVVARASDGREVVEHAISGEGLPRPRLSSDDRRLYGTGVTQFLGKQADAKCMRL